MCYDNGDGVDKDPTKAIEWYSKAADQGYAIAQYALGICYLRGNGVNSNEVNATYWLQKAAMQGDTNAQLVLDKIRPKWLQPGAHN